MIHRIRKTRRLQAGNATVETIVALVALVPFLIGIPLLGKQLDVKHKSYDATRYSVWERTVYRSDAEKSADDIALEARDRTLGNARAGMLSAARLQTAGVTENVLWRDRGGRRLLVENRDGQPQPVSFNGTRRESPVAVGAATVPQIAYGANAVANALMASAGVEPLGFDRNSFATASVTVRLRPTLGELADRPLALRSSRPQQSERPPIEQTAAGGILSDTWSSRSEADLRTRIDYLVANERMWQAEMPGMALGFLGAKGTMLYGEGQYGFGRGYTEGPSLTVPSTSLPNNYVYTPPRR